MELDFRLTLDVCSNVLLTRFFGVHSAICDCLSFFPAKTNEALWLEWKESVCNAVNSGAILEADVYRVEFNNAEIIVYSQFDDSWVLRQSVVDFCSAYDLVVSLQLAFQKFKEDLDCVDFKNNNLLRLPAAIDVGLLIPELGTDRVLVSPLREAACDWRLLRNEHDWVGKYLLKDAQNPTSPGVDVEIERKIIRRAVAACENSKLAGLRFNRTLKNPSNQLRQDRICRRL